MGDEEERKRKRREREKNRVKPERGVVLPPDDTEIQLVQENPKRGKSAVRYERYKIARTFSEYYALGGSRGDAKFDLSRGFITIIKEGVGIKYNNPNKKRKATRTAPLINAFSIYMRRKKEKMIRR